VTKLSFFKHRLNKVRRCLEQCLKGVELDDGIPGAVGALFFVLLSGTERTDFNGLVECGGGFLLLFGLGKVRDRRTSLVHVSAEFVVAIGPLCLFAVSFQSSETLAGLNKNGLFLGDRFIVIGLVEGVLTGLSVDGVRRVNLSALIGTVGGSLGVRSTVSNKTEDRESGGFSGGGIGSGRNQGGSGGGNSC